MNNVRHEQELELIAARGVKITRLSTIIAELGRASFMIQSASGADFADLVGLATASLKS